MVWFFVIDRRSDGKCPHMASSLRQLFERIRRGVADFAGDREDKHQADVDQATIGLRDSVESVEVDPDRHPPTTGEAERPRGHDADADARLRFELGIPEADD